MLSPPSFSGEGPTVLHVLLENSIGGAELAAHSARAYNPNVHLYFLRKSESGQLERNVHHGPFRRFWIFGSIFHFFNTQRQIKPQVTVFSMWKSLPALLVTRVFFPKITTVVLLHAQRNAHIIDWLAHVIMTALAHHIWSDSKSSLSKISPARGQSARIVSFLINHKTRITSDPARPNFVFWGRLNYIKNLPAALRLFSEICVKFPDAKFTIIGPDDGVLPEAMQLAGDLNLGKNIEFLGVKNAQDILGYAKQSNFYLQLSIFEGMAISVVEAMQYGLVPIVTPVGEIGNYANHMKNAIVHTTQSETLKCIGRLLDEPKTYKTISEAASQYWIDHPTYGEAFSQACKDVAGSPSKNPTQHNQNG